MQQPFEDIASKHRRELHVHCYRMLGSLSEAEDVVQEVLLKAWRGLDAFEGRSSLRTWLYKIATNACLDVLDKRGPRLPPSERFEAANPAQPLGTPLSPSEFIDPFPHGDFGGSFADARITARESVALAFIAALERLPPMQRAVLVLRDVMDFSASETAALLDKTVAAVESALERARASTDKRQAPSAVPVTQHDALLRRYLRAWEDKDASALTALLREDASLAMPPLAAWFKGREAIGAFVAGLLPHLGELRGQAIAISGGVGVAIWTRRPGAARYAATSLSALTIEGDAVVAIDTYLAPQLFRYFDLPAELTET